MQFQRQNPLAVELPERLRRLPHSTLYREREKLGREDGPIVRGEAAPV
jgi:hypothetical protein